MPKLNSLCQNFTVMTVKFFVSAFVDRFADLRHQIVIEIEVVENCQTHTEHFVRLEKMADITAGIETARRAITVGIDRQRISLIFAVIDIHRTLPGEDIAVTGISGGHNAVKEVNASVDGFQNIDRRTDTHQIAGLILGHKGLYRVNDVIHHLCLFTYGKTTDRVTGEIEFLNALHMIDTDIVDKTKQIANEAIERCFRKGVRDANQIKTAIRDDVAKFIFRETKRKPMILPILMEV